MYTKVNKIISILGNIEYNYSLKCYKCWRLKRNIRCGSAIEIILKYEFIFYLELFKKF